jgi:type I restriction enzyme M protein
MLTGPIRNQVDSIWNDFWTGGITNPLSVIEQFSYLLFIKRLDDIQRQKERKAQVSGEPIEDPIFNKKQQKLRWHRFKDLDPREMFDLVKGEVFDFMKNLRGEDSAFAQHMKDAIFMIPKPALLDKVVQKIDAIPMDDRDTKGDLYEYLLARLTTAGVNGQFRTPRHISA